MTNGTEESLKSLKTGFAAFCSKIAILTKTVFSNNIRKVSSIVWDTFLVS